MRCMASALDVYHMSMSYIQRVNVVCHETCFQSLGICVHLMYPFGASCVFSSLLARMPACGRPYMPLITFKYKYPLMMSGARLYSLMNFWGTYFMAIWAYSGWSRDIQVKVADIAQKNCPLGTETTLFKCSLTVMRSAVWVVTSPGYLTLSPPMVSLMHSGAAFCGHMSTAILIYATFPSLGIVFGWTKYVVFVP